MTLAHLAPFVRDSHKKYYDKYINWGFDQDKAEEYADRDTRREVSDGVQTLIYQLNSLTTTNGQAPFITISLYMNETKEYKQELAMLIEEMLRQRYQGMKNRQGVYVSPAFPKLVYVLEEDNIEPGSKYWYLTELAAKTSAKRLVPDYVSEKIMKKYKIDDNGNGNCYPPMGCRSFLTPYINDDGKPQYWGRYNIGVTTINLVDVALSSHRDIEEFWKIMDERIELCHTVQRIRAERLKETPAKVAPILWCDGAFARLSPDDKIEKAMKPGYFTSSIGYAGLYECVKHMTGYSHTDEGGKAFALEVMQYMNDKCNKWKAEEQIAYSLYGSPIEATTYTFAKALKKRFGIVEGITDRDYITNSYHVPVFEKIDPFSKLKFESEFQQLSPGGAISYVETSNLQNNTAAVLSVIRYIYDNIMYAELNTKSDYCQECGYDGEIILDEDENGKHYWRCPNCGNTDQEKMNIARRVCGKQS